jgi:protein-disulfide isomerase
MPQATLSRHRIALLIALALTPLVSSPVLAQRKESKPSPSDVVATIGDKEITDAQLEELAKERLARLRSEEYNIKRQVLDDYITRTLLEKEAKARGITIEELERREIDAKLLPVTADQKRAVYESSPQQFQGKSEAEAFAQIEANLKRIRVGEARRKLLADLKAKTPVSVKLQPPRVDVAVGDDPASGPTDAPVTIVEFSDFQCPACGRAFPTVKRLMDQYKGKLRVVFRDFPLPMHPQAPKAAEAAACANEQGKFWEMHDRLFSNQQALQVADLKRHAKEIGLETSKFDACLDSGKHAAAWRADMEAGRKLGVGSTPTFFINGRMITGAAPYQAFAEIVDQELARSTGDKVQ